MNRYCNIDQYRTLSIRIVLSFTRLVKRDNYALKRDVSALKGDNEAIRREKHAETVDILSQESEKCRDVWNRFLDTYLRD
jgi:hypothetical protein